MLAASGASLLWWRFGKGHPQEIERRRRERLERLGRIAQCEIVDTVEGELAIGSATAGALGGGLIPSDQQTRRRAVVAFRYTISGVSYETAETVVGPAGKLALPVSGQSAIVKYDPANPANCILLVGSWCETGVGAVRAAFREKGK